MIKYNLLTRAKEWYKDRQYTKAYREFREINKEIALRKEALDGTIRNHLTDNFVDFLGRRIDMLKKRKSKIDTRLTKFMTS